MDTVKSEELYAGEIQKFGIKNIPLFVGVFALDQLPRRKLRAPFCLVLNVQRSNLPGLHWIAVWVDGDGSDTVPRRGEIFDPLGMPPPMYAYKWLAEEQGVRGKVTRSYRMAQHPRSSVCGHFALYYCAFRLRCQSMSGFFAAYLGSDLAQNYASVKEFYEKFK